MENIIFTCQNLHHTSLVYYHINQYCALFKKKPNRNEFTANDTPKIDIRLT